MHLHTPPKIAINTHRKIPPTANSDPVSTKPVPTGWTGTISHAHRQSPPSTRACDLRNIRADPAAHEGQKGEESNSCECGCSLRCAQRGTSGHRETQGERQARNRDRETGTAGRGRRSIE
eukprot:213128-Pleurochrysis_carterae.AAC.1